MISSALKSIYEWSYTRCFWVLFILFILKNNIHLINTFSNLLTFLFYKTDEFFQVYGLQSPKERISHDAKYNIKRAEKSMFNLTTPKKNKSKNPNPGISTNPVNNLSIRKSKFGMVGYTTITIDTLKNKTFTLEQVPSR